MTIVVRSERCFAKTNSEGYSSQKRNRSTSDLLPGMPFVIPQLPVI